MELSSPLTDFALSVNCFTCCFVSSVKWLTHVSSIVMSPRTNFLTTKHCQTAQCLTALILFHVQNFSHYAIHSTLWNALPCLLAQALSVDAHPIPFCGFSSPFLTWSPQLVDHCDVVLTSRLNSSKHCHSTFYSRQRKSRLSRSRIYLDFDVGWTETF